MSWVLFCQIEIIILTIGLVLMFTVSINQTAKDNSFYKRVNVLGKVLSEHGKTITNTFNNKGE